MKNKIDSIYEYLNENKMLEHKNERKRKNGKNI